MKLRIGAFWQALLVVVAAWALFNWAVMPFMPRSVMITYMIIVSVGVMLYYTSDEQRWLEFTAPILDTLRKDNRWPLRWSLLVAFSGLSGFLVFETTKPSIETPLELRQVHPSPPASSKAYGKSYDLARLENPLREAVLAQLAKDPDAAWEQYTAIVDRGREVYYANCFYCHGDQLNGKGHFAQGLDPLPTNFRDVGTIAQLQESFLFWRITTGGPGLPKGGMPWKSAMPVWHEMLDEEEVWSVIAFLYDNVEQVPRMWDPAVSKAVTGMKDKVVRERNGMDAAATYQYWCAHCHGETGAGDGPSADSLYPRPRDFTLGLYKYKSSVGDLPPSDEDLFDVIKFGLVGTSMPGWSEVLTDQEITNLVTVVKQLDTSAAWAPEDAADEDFDDEGRYLKTSFRKVERRETADGQIPYSAESVAKGKEVFVENCEKCHGEQGRGDLTSGEFLDDDWGYRIWPRDLTKPWTWRVTEASRNSGGDAAKIRDLTIRNIYTRLSIGIPGTPMPAHRAYDEGEDDAIGPEDRWHVANYTYSLREDATAPGNRPIIEALEVSAALPDSPDDAAWESAPASTFRLLPNVVKEERLFTPLNDAITVRALYNDTEIAFLLEVNDRTDSRPGGPVMSQLPDPDEEMFSDALAVQFPKQDAYSAAPVDKPLYRHGDPAHPTTIWYWNAGSVDPEVEARAVLLDAKGPGARLQPRQEADGFTATGEWRDGRWRVVMKRPRGLAGADAAQGNGDLQFREGEFIPVAFANWDGNNGEIGSRHTMTPWYWLLLPPEVSLGTIYAQSVGTGAAVFLAGVALIRNQRRRKPEQPPARLGG